MDEAKLVNTLMTNHFKMFCYQSPKYNEEIHFISKVSYANIIGCLMYKMVCTRLDSTHTVNMILMFMAILARNINK